MQRLVEIQFSDRPCLEEGQQGEIVDRDVCLVTNLVLTRESTVSIACSNMEYPKAQNQSFL